MFVVTRVFISTVKLLWYFIVQFEQNLSRIFIFTVDSIKSKRIILWCIKELKYFSVALIYSIYSYCWMPNVEICNWHKLSIWFFINLFTLQTSKEFQNQNKMVFIANICKKMMWNCQLQYKLNVTVLLPCQYCREMNWI